MNDEEVYVPTKIVVAKLGTGVAVGLVTEDRVIYLALPRKSAVSLLDAMLEILDAETEETIQ